MLYLFESKRKISGIVEFFTFPFATFFWYRRWNYSFLVFFYSSSATMQNEYVWTQTSNLNHLLNQPHLKYFPHHIGIFQWQALTPLQSNNLPILYWKSTKMVIKFTRNSFHKTNTVSFPHYLLFAGHYFHKKKRRFFVMMQQAVTSNNHCHIKMGWIGRSFSLNVSFGLSLQRSFMCWMCRHLLDYIFLPFIFKLYVFVYYLPSSELLSLLLLCCKRPDCPFNVSFYITYIYITIRGLCLASKFSLLQFSSDKISSSTLELCFWNIFFF